MKKMIIILLVSLLASCVSRKPIRQAKRAQRKLNKAIKLDPSILKVDTILYRDTLTVIDSVFVEGFKDDTTSKLVLNDTATVYNKNNIQVKYIYDSHTGDIRHEIAKHDTIYIDTLKVPAEAKIPCKQVVQKQVKRSGVWRFLTFLFALMLLLVLALREKKDKTEINIINKKED